ncbi:hypothetical protein OH76DRAFT_1421970 [Lentinus brumalis]|uniref:Uncharacterized protein n=1 Tax=Lentinus brumalis TaxID=2498619 RepID=A0A371CT37_9APHY|nr:hypothetical protein OH76DRAFT_1421970 [Polyporus brumalis]
MSVPSTHRTLSANCPYRGSMENDKPARDTTHPLPAIRALPPVSTQEHAVLVEGELQEADRDATPTPALQPPLGSADTAMQDAACETLYSPLAGSSPLPRAPMLGPTLVELDDDVAGFHLPPPAMPVTPEFPMSSYGGIYYAGEEVATLRPPNPLPLLEGDENSRSGTRLVRTGPVVPTEATREEFWVSFEAPSIFDRDSTVIFTTRRYQM